MTSPAPIPRLRRSILGDDVYETITALILEHSIAPGDRINIDALARQLDVSATPVREALARLESDGLVRKRALVGYTVSPLLTRAEFMDMFDMRLVLEGAAARWAAERADDDTRQQILREAGSMVVPESTEADGWQAHAVFTKVDAQFHDLIAGAADNPLLRDGIARLHSHLHIHRLYFPFGQAGTTGDEHSRIASAISAGDSDGAEAAMREHLIQARQRHLEVFGEA
ncbi:DNA-binding GntR family transcriptional regulator [Allocatelliglobosispora scoriae]|uniref:DNA-binding GntR family transcriptional regulator n=1 Tax=Allocatelliglobosispora scoriae TaxID=643052 RepID=A0A841BM90_9ACTN|nr:GntR family transcriptional regulator [Allocatelliglobosispora scoriae]MBB5868376.1 DNA-binding GntR family transcriptional regulator [Allocatelliglobosispora scoriae]